MFSVPVETDNKADTLTAHRDNPRIPHRTALQTSYVRALVNRDGEVENTTKQVFTFQLLLLSHVYHKETPKKSHVQWSNVITFANERSFYRVTL